MKLKRGGIIFIVVGAVLAISAAGLFYVYASRIALPNIAAVQGAVPTAVPEKTEVLVLAKDVPANTIITSDMVKKSTVEKDGVKADDAVEASQVLGKMTTNALKANQRLSTSQLTSASFSYSVPNGKRAIAVAVDDLSSVAGLIEDGDYIDLIAGGKTAVASNPDGSSSGGQPEYAKTVLQDVQVLRVIRSAPATTTATDGQTDGQAASQPAQQEKVLPPAGIMILAVTDQQAEVLKYAVDNGSLLPVLRAKNDHALEDTTGINDRILSEHYGVPVP
jgi:pilus assembly protein CpaB